MSQFGSVQFMALPYATDYSKAPQNATNNSEASTPSDQSQRNTSNNATNYVKAYSY